MNRGTNPVFTKIKKENTEGVTYGASYGGILVKTAVLFGVLIVSAIGSLFILANAPEFYIPLLIISMIMAILSVVVASFSTRLAPVFSVIYSLSEGVLLGMISLLFSAAFPEMNIIFLAVVITFGIFAGMLVLYSTKLIVASNRFRRIMMGISFAILFTVIIVGLVSIFDQGAMWYTLFGNPNSPLVLLLTLLLILYGAFMLVISFDDAKNIVSSGADKKYEWQVGLGLIVSTVYIYVQVLRLLAILASRNK